jgi:hypothetical protein
MTIGVGHTVILTDHDAVQVSTARAQRIAAELLDTLRKLSATPSEPELIACANNLATGWGEYGLVDAAPHTVDPAAVTAPIDLDEIASGR